MSSTQNDAAPQQPRPLTQKQAAFEQINNANTLYDRLGVEPNASTDDIKAAFKKLTVLTHPDRNEGSVESNNAEIKLIEAYKTLSDPEKRTEYDKGLKEAQSQSTGPQTTPTSTPDATKKDADKDSDEKEEKKATPSSLGQKVGNFFNKKPNEKDEAMQQLIDELMQMLIQLNQTMSKFWSKLLENNPEPDDKKKATKNPETVPTPEPQPPQILAIEWREMEQLEDQQAEQKKEERVELLAITDSDNSSKMLVDATPDSGLDTNPDSSNVNPVDDNTPKPI